MPSVGASAGAGQDFDSDGGDRSSFSLRADAAWEVDLFGGIRRGVEAAEADADGAVFDLAAVPVAILGQVASNYLPAPLAQQRPGTARDTRAPAAQKPDAAGWRARGGPAPPPAHDTPK